MKLSQIFAVVKDRYGSLRRAPEHVKLLAKELPKGCCRVYSLGLGVKGVGSGFSTSAMSYSLSVSLSLSLYLSLYLSVYIYI